MNFHSISQALEDIKNGKIVVVVDDENRENEGDLITSAETVTPEILHFMVTHCSGIICTPLTTDMAKKFDLPLMVEENTELFGTRFTISIDYKHGTHSGVSCSDRAKTILALASNTTNPNDFARPGHIFPLLAKEKGVFERKGHTEATVDLMKLSGLKPVGVLSELIDPKNGEMMRGEDLFRFSEAHGLSIISIEDLWKYRKEKSL